MKDSSDIFICELKRGGYWAYPSPFVAHGCNFEIRFRNLTKDTIQIDLGAAPVHKRELSLEPGEADSVNVNGDAKAGLHEYRAVVKPKKAVAGNPACEPEDRPGRGSHEGLEDEEAGPHPGEGRLAAADHHRHVGSIGHASSGSLRMVRPDSHST